MLPLQRQEIRRHARPTPEWRKPELYCSLAGVETPGDSEARVVFLFFFAGYLPALEVAVTADVEDRCELAHFWYVINSESGNGDVLLARWALYRLTDDCCRIKPIWVGGWYFEFRYKIFLSMASRATTWHIVWKSCPIYEWRHKAYGSHKPFVCL